MIVLKHKFIIVCKQVAPTAAASGHGNSSSGQYKGQGGYGSAGGYGSGYEAGAADYSKVGGGTGGYANSPAQTKAAAGTPTGPNPSSTNTDLAASMYGKSHATLSKVNVSSVLVFFYISCKNYVKKRQL